MESEIVQDIRWPKIAVAGAGAVGCYFGGMLARAGAPVTLIGRRRLVEAIAKEPLLLDTAKFSERVKVTASEDPAAAADAEIVLFCVKGFDTESTATALAPHLGPRAIVLSLQNGVDNAERIRTVTGGTVVPAVVYVGVSMKGPGHVKHVGRGDLILGEVEADRYGAHSLRSRLEDIASLFSRAGIPCRVSDGIETDLWTKMVMNCAYNAISALGRASYRPLVGNSFIRPVLTEAIGEAVAVARVSGATLSEEKMVSATIRLAEAMPEATSSTAQDIELGKRTEIDSLIGYVVKMGARHGIATPVNQTLHALVKLLEDHRENPVLETTSKL